jgi:hypothetical protein
MTVSSVPRLSPLSPRLVRPVAAVGQNGFQIWTVVWYHNMYASLNGRKGRSFSWECWTGTGSFSRSTNDSRKGGTSAECWTGTGSFSRSTNDSRKGRSFSWECSTGTSSVSRLCCCVTFTVHCSCIVLLLFLYYASLFLYCATLIEVFPYFFHSCKANARL